jgi:hypothetical protein
MSQRYEVDDANCELAILTPSDDPGEYRLDLDDGNYALVIGNPWASAFAIEGSPDDLRAFAQRVQGLVKRSLPEPASQNRADQSAS